MLSLNISEKILLNRIYQFPFECEFIGIETLRDSKNAYDNKYILKCRTLLSIKNSNLIHTCSMCDDSKILCVDCGYCCNCNYTNCKSCKTFLDVIFDPFYVRHEYINDNFYFYVIEPDDTYKEGIHEFFIELYLKKQQLFH